jgi:DNA replicative helicase MCM subunit Mcm2 (Cdc46/Mcm family)
MPFEVRQLEGLQRASFARAKILMKSEVSVKDVDVIIDLYKKSLESLYLEVSDTMVQSQFEDSSSKKKSKEKTLRDVFISLEDENRLVDKTELFKKLMSDHPEQFADAYECDDFFKKYEGSRFLIDGNTGKYKFRL